MLGSKFSWVTDNSSMKFVRTMTPPKAITKRWLSLLASFDFEVIHKKNAHLIHVDYLSRDGAKMLEQPIDKDENSEEEDVRINEILEYGTLEEIDWKKFQEEDSSRLFSFGQAQNYLAEMFKRFENVFLKFNL